MSVDADPTPPSAVLMPSVAADVPLVSSRGAAESSFSDSSDSPPSRTGRRPSSSDSDPEAECDVDLLPTVQPVSDRVFAVANSLGPDYRTFAALELLPQELLPYHLRAGRIIHWDIIHSELASVPWGCEARSARANAAPAGLREAAGPGSPPR